MGSEATNLPELSRARSDGETPEDYVRAVGLDSETAFAACIALFREGVSEKELSKAKVVWLHRRVIEDVEWFHGKGHSRRAAENLIRRRVSALSDREVEEILDAHDWSNQS